MTRRARREIEKNIERLRRMGTSDEEIIDMMLDEAEALAEAADTRPREMSARDLLARIDARADLVVCRLDLGPSAETAPTMMPLEAEDVLALLERGARQAEGESEGEASR